MCPQTVGPTIPGEGLWNVLTRVGAAMDVIESQICAVHIMSSNLDCSFPVTQADIGGGGIFTITVPGTYCLTQNVTFTAGPAITVSASNVTIDLQGHYIDGGSNAVGSAIQLATGVGSNLNSITIQNGTIQNVSAATFAQAISQGGTNSSLANIVIRDMDFYNIGNPVFGGYAFYAQVNGILIENCNTFNGGYLQANAVGGGAVFRNIWAEQYLSGNSGIVANSTTIPWASVVIEDCILTTSLPPLGTGFGAQLAVSGAANTVIRNCVVDGSVNAGFVLTQITNLVISDCIAQNVVNDRGFN